MWILFAALSAVLLLILIRQRTLYRKLQKEIEYISNRLAALSITSENGFVLLPAAHICVRKLGAAVNTLLCDTDTLFSEEDDGYVYHRRFGKS